MTTTPHTGVGRGLAGLRIGITADRKGAELAAMLTRGGAQVLHGRTMTTVAPESDALLATETTDLLAARPTWVAVSTGSGLRAWLQAADTVGAQEQVVDMLCRTRTVARGAKSLGALRALGAEPEFTSRQETMDDVCSWLGDAVGVDDVLGIQVHGGEVVGTLGALRDKLAGVHTVSPYRWVLPVDREPAERLVAALVAGDVHVLACTSAPTVRNLRLVAAGMGAADALAVALRDRVCVAAVGPVTARAFEEMGVPVTVMPTRGRTGDLVRAITAWAGRGGSTDGVGPLRLVPGARAVRIDDAVVVLGRQEFAVLAALVRRPGVALRTESLALDAFGHRVADASTLKHQVSRVRRKLGPHAACVETVRGVGYRYAPDAPIAAGVPG